jgi:hypothetical protein
MCTGVPVKQVNWLPLEARGRGVPAGGDKGYQSTKTDAFTGTKVQILTRLADLSIVLDGNDYLYVCWRMLTYADVCWTHDLSIVLDGKDYPCWGLAVVILNWEELKRRSGIYERFEHQGMTYADVCWRKLTYADFELGGVEA